MKKREGHWYRRCRALDTGSEKGYASKTAPFNRRFLMIDKKNKYEMFCW